MEEDKDGWVCTCGRHNEVNFCANCGKKKEDVVSQQTQVMPPIQPSAPVSEMYSSVMPASMVPRKNNTVKYLAATAIILFLAAVGLYAYISGSEDRYLSQCEAVQKNVLGVQSKLKGIKDLNGDPDSDDTKQFIKDLGTASDTLEKRRQDLKGMRVSKKYEEQNTKLLDAIALEETILQDTQNVLKEPLGKDSGASVKTVKENVQQLTNQAGDIQIEKLDFPADFQLSILADDLNMYISKKKSLDAARKAEAERKAREEAAAKAAAFHQRLAANNQTLKNNTNEVVWITTDVTAKGNQLVLTGYFYNGTLNPIISMDNMDLHIVLKKDGNTVLDDTTLMRSRQNLGFLKPGAQYNTTFTANGAPSEGFDEFEVESLNTHWTYRQNP